MGINKFITFADKHFLPRVFREGSAFAALTQYLLRLIIEIMYSYYLGIIALFVFCVLSENGALRCGQSARLILILAVLRIQAGDLERILLMPGGH